MPHTVSITSSNAGKATEFYTKAIFEGRTLATKGIDIKADVPYKLAIRGYDLTNFIQSGSSCSWNNNGATVITEQVLDVKPFYINITECYADYKTSWNYSSQTELPSDVADKIESMVKSNVATDVDSRSWLGNTTGGTNYVINQFDGYLRQIRKGSPVLQTGVTLTTANIAAELNKVLIAMPDAISTKDPSEVVIYVSMKAEKLLRAYQSLIANPSVVAGVKGLDFQGYEVRGSSLPTNIMVAGLRESFHFISNTSLPDATFEITNMFPVLKELNARVSGYYSYNVAVTNIPQIVLYN